MLWGALIAWLGVGIAPYLVIQAVVGFSLLEVVNYMEHYGMLRQKVGVGERQRYERVDPSHSWNSNNIATNVLLYHLQRHSDHHANPTRRYQALRDFEESPGAADRVRRDDRARDRARRLAPGDGPARASAHFDGDVTRANISPRKRDRILAKYAAARPRSRRRAATRARDRGATAPATRCWPPAAPAAATSTRSRPATSTRASRPAPRGPTSPTTGAAPTAACARRSTSSPSIAERSVSLAAPYDVLA